MSIFSSNRDTNKDTQTTPSYTPPVQSAPAAASQPIQQSPSYSSSPVTSISEGTTLEGQIKIEGDIKIEGTIKGTVTSKGKVIITPSGKVDGDIICGNGDIAGRVHGKLKVADVLFLKGNAVIDGDINTGKLVIESGVKFNGNCAMGVSAANTTATTSVNKTEATVKTPNDLHA